MLKIKLFKGMGRGLVSVKPVKRGQVVHIAEVIHLSRKDAKTVSKTLLDSYVYDLGSGTVGIALGLGSLFNHKQDNNIDFKIKSKAGRKLIYYVANCNIPAGQQLFLNYGYEP
jgi:uncharacterized protein